MKFTLTFRTKAKRWCESLPVSSTHIWNQFITNSLHKFELICLRFKFEDRPSNIELMELFEYVFFLPYIPNNCQEPGDVMF